MVLEYTASAALAELRGLAWPASLGTAVLSRGSEEHAAFSPQAALAAAAMVPRLRTMLACELVAAVRGLRQRGVSPAVSPLLAETRKRWQSGERWHADIEALRVIHPGLRTLADWLAESGAAAIRAQHATG